MREHALRVPRLIRKALVKQRFQFAAIELADVKCIGNVAGLVVDGSIR